MNNQLKQDLGWFWYYWLWTTESVEGRLTNVVTSGARTTVTVRQDGQMPSPVVLKVKLAGSGAAPKASGGARVTMVDAHTAVITWPVDVWFGGSRTFDAVFETGGRAVESVILDPSCRFPDRDPNDNVWPAPSAPLTGTARAYVCG